MAWSWAGLFRREAKMNSLELFRELYGARMVKSGIPVNWKTALEVTTVLACARVIAEGIAQVPLQLYRVSPDGKTRLPAVDHPLYRLLYRKPNQWQTSFGYRETLAMHLVLTGNAYSFINRPLRDITELIPIQPQFVQPHRDSQGFIDFYLVTIGTRSMELKPEQVWHIRGPSWMMDLGLEAVYLAREAIGLALATEETHAKLHANGVRPAGTYSVAGTLNATQQKQLADWIKEHFAGENAHAPLILDRDAKWLSQAITGVDAQHLETRRMQVEEICRALRVMPIMIGHADKTATYASAEQMFLAHVVHTLSPWYERIEQSIDTQLISDKDAEAGVYAKFCEEGLLRSSMLQTAQYLNTLKGGGFITTNEGRSKLEMNPDPDPESDKIQQPANITGAKPDAGGASASGNGA
jgi:HK97 family phage portal protein